jgi:trk system potassium uptake protein TrkA
VFNPEEEAARWTVQRLLISDITNYFELAEGFSVVELEAPASIVGKTLEQLNLRRRFRLNLVAIKEKAAADGCEARFNPVPAPEQGIRAGDVLALVGSVLDLANFVGTHE